MIFVDTNIFLRYFTKDDEEKAKEVLELLKKVDRGEEEITTSSLVIFETIFTLNSYYEVPREKIKDLIFLILDLKGLKLRDKRTYKEALEIYANKNISFADAFNYAFAKKKGLDQIYSYDEDFDTFKDIKRITP